MLHLLAAEATGEGWAGRLIIAASCPLKTRCKEGREQWLQLVFSTLFRGFLRILSLAVDGPNLRLPSLNISAVVMHRDTADSAEGAKLELSHHPFPCGCQCVRPLSAWLEVLGSHAQPNVQFTAYQFALGVLLGR